MRLTFAFAINSVNPNNIQYLTHIREVLVPCRKMYQKPMFSEQRVLNDLTRLSRYLMICILATTHSTGETQEDWERDTVQLADGRGEGEGAKPSDSGSAWSSINSILSVSELCGEPVSGGTCSHHCQERVHPLPHPRYYNLRTQGKACFSAQYPVYNTKIRNVTL